MSNILAIDIGGTTIKTGLYHSATNELTSLKSYPTEIQKETNNILTQVLNIIDNIKEDIDGVAISSAGVIDSEAGKVVYSGYTIPNYKDTNFKKAIFEHFGLPVSVENDVNCALLGEYWQGNAKGSESVVCLTIGTGIGGALLLNNEIYHGNHFAAGEVGYMIVNGKYFQDIGSTSSLVERIKKRKKSSDPIDGKTVIQLAKKNDPVSIEELTTMLESIAIGIVNIIYLLNPHTIILGGGIMEAFDFLKPKLHDHIQKLMVNPYFYQTEILPAKFGNSAGMLGAIYHYLKEHQLLN